MTRLLFVLVALLSMATGAWAQTSFTVKEITAEMLQKFTGDNNPLKTSDLPEFKMVSVDEAKTWADFPNGNALLLYCPKGDNGAWYTLVYANGAFQVDADADLTRNGLLDYTSFGTRIFYTALPDEWELTPVEGQQQQWSFTMRAYNVVLTPIYEPEYVAAFVAGNANTIEAGKATLTLTDAGVTTNVGANLVDGKLSPLYEGQQLTLTAAQGYKFRSVKVEPTVGLKTITIGSVTLKYADGDTWAKIVERNPDKISIADFYGYPTVHSDSGFLMENMEGGEDVDPVTSTKVIDAGADYFWTD